MDYFSISWKQLHKDTHTLSKQIVADKKDFDLIVAIARGGFTIAHMLSDFLRLPVASFTISSYKDMKRVELSEIAFHVGGDLKNKKILLVDDVSDTGKTFIRGITYLKELGADTVTTASPYIKPWTKFTPDYSVTQTDKWIVFPYDVRETIEAFQKIHTQEGKDAEHTKKQLKTIKFSSHFVTHYLKK
jgi:hypoxanthine phosphoribosyltransferase